MSTDNSDVLGGPHVAESGDTNDSKSTVVFQVRTGIVGTWLADPSQRRPVGISKLQTDLPAL